ncbi:MAG: FecR domain-containing protein [Candidatus Omnitrophica bacterium]|nr:FecR domain-containing protein [Candidatus Omnitrophota bacterium]
MKYFKILTFLFANFLFLTATFITAKGEEAVIISYIEGTAEVLLSGQPGWQNAKKGMLLGSGDSIKTHKESSMEISFDGDTNLVNIEENTHVVIKLDGIEKLELIDGEILALVKSIPKGSRFEIRTPTAVCGARGTGWGANAKKDETVVDCYENKAYAKGIDKKGNIMEDNLTVPKGSRTIVKLFQKPSKLMKLAGKDFGKWNKWKESLFERGLSKKARMERLSRDLTKIQQQKEKIIERKDEDRIRKREQETGAGTSTRGPECMSTQE